MRKLPFAENINYWKTSKSSPDTWIEKAEKLVNDFGGRVHMHAYGIDHATGRRAYMFAFEIKGDNFKIVYPVLPTWNDRDELAAKRQAATLLHHHVKSRLLEAKIFGAKTAFFSHFILPDGRTPIDLTDEELMTGLPLFNDIGTKMIELKEKP